MDSKTFIIILVIGIITLVVFCIIGLYNIIINSKNIVNDKWYEINKQIDNKAKLLSKLIEVAKSYCKTEDINTIIEVKNKLINVISINDKIETNNKLDNILNQIYNNYEKLNNDKKFIDIKESLDSIDDKINYAKEFYDEAATKHNKLIKKIPFNLIALLFKFKTYITFDK